jgi:hypothetical protein
MTFTGEIDGTGLDWLCRVARCLDARDLDDPDLRPVRDAVGRAVSASIRVSSRA